MRFSCRHINNFEGVLDIVLSYVEELADSKENIRRK